MSDVEQNGAGREAEAGNVGSKSDPLQGRGEGEKKKDNVTHLIEEKQTKGLKNCLPPKTQSTATMTITQPCSCLEKYTRAFVFSNENKHFILAVVEPSSTVYEGSRVKGFIWAKKQTRPLHIRR